MTSMFSTKSLSALTDQAEGVGPSLRRTLGPWNLLGLGIGAIIGAGLFSLTGIVAAHNAGPAIVFSFMFAAVGCGFAAMCYSEMASMIPIAGSAYTYAYATLGELTAWIIGWDLILEYAVGAGTVSVSWSRYVVSLLHQWGVDLPIALTKSPFETVTLDDGTVVSGLINLPALAVVVLISMLLIRGIEGSAKVNAAIVVVKVAVVLTVIGVGAFFVKAANYHPFLPENTGTFGEFGWSGVIRGAGVIFFAYVGFDAVSTAAQEARRPQRDMAVGIIGSLIVCTILYILFALVLTGMVNYKSMLNDAAPVATAIDQTPFPWLKTAVKIGIIGGFTTVILVMLLGQSRVFYALARDGFIPSFFADIHPRFQTPWRANLVFMVFTGLLGALVPISILGEMTSIGTLLAFVIVCAGVIVLRRTHPREPRGYRTPGVPVTPILGILFCVAMMVSLDIDTWIRLIVWLLIGFVLYFAYGRAHSRLAPGRRIA